MHFKIITCLVFAAITAVQSVSISNERLRTDGKQNIGLTVENEVQGNRSLLRSRSIEGLVTTKKYKYGSTCTTDNSKYQDKMKKCQKKGYVCCCNNYYAKCCNKQEGHKYSCKFKGDSLTGTPVCKDTTKKAETCESPEISNVKTSTGTFTPQGSIVLQGTLDNSGNTEDATLTTAFIYSYLTSSTVTYSDSIGVSVGTSVSVKGTMGFYDVTGTVHYDVTDTFTYSEASVSSETMSFTNTCSSTVAAGDITTVSAYAQYGYFDGDWTGTRTCADGSTETVSGTLSADNLMQSTVFNCAFVVTEGYSSTDSNTAGVWNYVETLPGVYEDDFE